MKSITKSMLLTVVIVFLGSLSWGQSGLCSSEKKNKESAQRYADQCRQKHGEKGTGDSCETENKKLNEASDELANCENNKAQTEASCKQKAEGLAELTKKFDYPAMKRAVKCYSADTDEPADTTRVVLMTMGGGAADDSSDICRVGGTNNDFTKDFEAQMKKIEQLEKDLNSVNEKLLTKAKEAQEKIKQLGDDRIALKEEFESKQSESEQQRERALQNMQENQLKLQETIRKANAELIDMRQKLVRNDRETERTLFKDGLDSLASMKRQCVGQQEKYCKDAPNRCKKRTSKGLGQATARGSGKVDDLSGMMETCLRALEKQRNAVFEDSGDLKIQIENNIRDRESAIADMNTQYKQQVDAFNKAIEREMGNLSKAQQAYYQKDQNMANQLMALQQAAQQEQIQLTQQKNSILQQIMAAQTTRGKASAEEVTSAVGSLKEYMSTVESFGPPMENGKPVAGASPRCPDLWSRYEPQLKEFGENRSKIDEVEATK